MHSTLTIHLTKTKYRDTVKVLDAWAQDALRLKNQVRFLQRCCRQQDEAKLPESFRNALLAAREHLAAAQNERGRDAEKALTWLPPAFLKWMFASSCLSWSDKGHFAALPSRIAQGIIDTVAHEDKSFLAALAAWHADKTAFRGKPAEPGFAGDGDLPTLEFQLNGIALQKGVTPDNKRHTLGFVFGSKSSGQKVNVSLTLPEAYETAEPIAVRFVPRGAVSTGQKTSFGKTVCKAVSWKLQLVFDVPQLTTEETAGIERQIKAERHLKDNATRGEKVMQTKALSKAIREAEEGKILNRKADLLKTCQEKANQGLLKVAGADPGERNLLTLAFPAGEEAVSVSGAKLNALNGWFAHLADAATSAVQADTTPEKGERRTDNVKLSELLARRDRKIEGWFSALSSRLVALLKERGIDVLFLGKAGRDWKEDIKKSGRTEDQRKTRNRAFQSIPYEKLLKRLETACFEQGILCIRIDESYTSATSFLDGETLHDLTCGKSVDVLKAENALQGRRTGSRFFLQNGTQIHADVNGALNIARRGMKSVFNVDLPTDLAESLTPSAFHRFARPQRHDILGNPIRLPARASNRSKTASTNHMNPFVHPIRNACAPAPSSGRRSMANSAQEAV